MSAGAPGCDEHARTPEELRHLADVLLQRLEPWLRAVTAPDGAGGAAGPGVPCAWCPLCALLGVLRGERPELAARLAEHAAGLLAVARELLTPPPGADEGAPGGPDGAGPDGAAPAGPEPDAAPAPPRRVQRIDVSPTRAAGGAGC